MVLLHFVLKYMWSEGEFAVKNGSEVFVVFWINIGILPSNARYLRAFIMPYFQVLSYAFFEIKKKLPLDILF